MASDILLRRAATRAAGRYPEFAGTILRFAWVQLGHAEYYASMARVLGTDEYTVARIGLCRAPTDRTPAGVIAWVREVAPAFGVDPERLAGILMAGLTASEGE